MMRSIALALLALCAVALASRTTGDYTPLCGSVFDGPAAGVDLDVQGATDKIEASWSGFENGMEKHRIIRYEWAVVSSHQFTPIPIESEQYACRPTPGFLGQPDTLEWTDVGQRVKVSASVKLTVGETYYVVVRATNSFGKLVFANSNGITIQAVASTPLFARAFGSASASSSPSDLKSLELRSEKRDTTFPRQDTPFTSNGLIYDFNLNCPIDAANRCEQSKIKVGDFLTKLYGPPEFTNPADKPGTIAIAGGSSDVIFKVVPVVQDDADENKSPGNVDNNPLNTGSAIGLAIGVVALFFVLFAIIVVVSGIIWRVKEGKAGFGSGGDEVDEH